MPPPPAPPARPVTSVKYGKVAVLVLLSAARTAVKSASIVERSDEVMFEDVTAAARALKAVVRSVVSWVVGEVV